MRGFVDVAEDEFSFAAGVSGADDARNTLGREDLADDLELLLRFFAYDKWPGVGEHRQEVTAPRMPFGSDLVRLGEGDQVPDGPGDDVSVAVQVAFTALGGAKDAGYVARD